MTDTDYSAQLTNIVAAGPDVIFAPYYYDTVGPYIVPQTRAAGYAGVILGADGWDGTTDTMVDDKSLYNNTYFINHYAADNPSEEVQNFVTSFTAAYGSTPNAIAAMARALMTDPRIVLMDEPSMGLSPLLVKEVFSIIKSLHEAGITVLLVEQNAKMALSIADRAYVLETGRIAMNLVMNICEGIAVLNYGRIIAKGTPEEIRKNPVVIEAYLGKKGDAADAES